MNKFRIILKYTLISILILYGLYYAYHLTKWWYNGSENIRKCGIVTFKGSAQEVNKHSTYNEYILVVQYSNDKEDHHVSAATWSSYNVGDNVCFTDEKPPKEFEDDQYGVIHFLLGAFTLIILFIGGLILFLGWLFTGKNILNEL